MRRVYLDHNATTKVRSEVLEAMMPFLADSFGNPSSLHGPGRQARVAIDNARQSVADALGAAPSEILFTSGGTEANNLAIQGVMSRMKKRGRGHMVTTAIEHEAVLKTFQWTHEQFGYDLSVIGVDSHGSVDMGEIAQKVTEETGLVSVMHANNEVGTFQPIAQIAEIAHNKNALVHTDAVQTFGKVPVSVKELGVDLLTVSGHKIYGPKGIGALYVKRGVRLDPLLFGGSHERDLRAGTENVAGIVALGEAARLAVAEVSENQAHVGKLSQRLEHEVLERISGSVVNGHPTERLSGTLNIGFGDLDGEALIHSLDLEGIAISSGSACASGTTEPSHVLLAMGATEAEARGVVRFSFGRDSTPDDVERVIEVLPGIVARLRALAPAGR